MIARIEGILDDLAGDKAVIRTEGGLSYEVLLPAYVSARLGGSLDQRVVLQTLNYLESQGQGATMFPRLAGFLTSEDRAFYELFVTVKGIGHRKALRAMVLDTPQLAGAIADRDLKLLQSLPEVGKRTAETIAVSLKGKVDRFLNAPAARTDSSGTAEGLAADEAAAGSSRSPLSRQALDVLMQLGEQRAQAVAWIDQALMSDEPPATVEELVAEAFRIKGG